VVLRGKEVAMFIAWLLVRLYYGDAIVRAEYDAGLNSCAIPDLYRIAFQWDKIVVPCLHFFVIGAAIPSESQCTLRTYVNAGKTP
jgi:hypothetical protein